MVLHLHLPCGPDVNQKFDIISTPVMSSVCVLPDGRQWNVSPMCVVPGCPSVDAVSLPSTPTPTTKPKHSTEVLARASGPSDTDE